MELLICVNFTRFWDFQNAVCVAPVWLADAVVYVIVKNAFLITNVNIIIKLIKVIILLLKIIEI